jgi:OFA family oxalate/formate antiporter-like MFS transporter
MMVSLEAVALASIAYWQDYLLYQTCIVILISCYGGMFATMPGYLSDLFGSEKLADILGIMLSAWGIAGFAGPKVLAYCLSLTGNYCEFFTIGAVAMLINFGLTLFLSERNILKI